MKVKFVLSILTILLFSFFVFSSSYAAPKATCQRNGSNLCKEDVELLVLQTFSPLINVIGKLAGQTEVQEERISELEKKVAVLEAKLTPTLTPIPTIVPSPTDELKPVQQ